MQPETQSCSQCGKALPEHLAGQPCPHCLMALGMNTADMPTASPKGQMDVHIPQADQVDAAFPDLEICHLIGHGGMGVVYQARQLNLNRVVALKILSPRLGQDPAFAERFLREAQTMAKLSHPNIVTVFDFGKAGEFYYLTMEFVDGVNLRDSISTNKISAAEALSIVQQVCEALQYAHDNGVVHRDIKPENILIDKSGSIKIADFGLAKILDPDPNQVSLTATQQVMGTRNYMAPEQLESPEFVDHRADLYSLGVVFYELLTGELPLGRFSLPSEKRPYVSGRLDDVVMRTLEKDPGRRFQKASQIKTACESLDKPMEREEREERGTHKTEANAAPMGPPLPVTLQDMYASLAAGYGLLRAYETHLELEFEIRDAVVDHRWASSRVRIPYERVASIHLNKKWWGSSITIQADQFDAVKDIPSSQQGKFNVYFKKKDLLTANQLIWQVKKQIGQEPAEMYPPDKGAVKSEPTSNGLILGVIFACFFGLCAVAAIGAFVVMMYSNVSKTPPETIESGSTAASAAVSVGGNQAQGSGVNVGATEQVTEGMNDGTDDATTKASAEANDE